MAAKQCRPATTPVTSKTRRIIIKRGFLLKKLVTVSAVGAVLFAQTVMPVSATPADDKANAESEISSINSELNSVIIRYDAAYSELTKTEEAITQKTAELATTRQNLSVARSTYDERVKGIYKYSDVNILEVLFGSKTINDFTERFDLLNKVGNADAGLVKSITQSEMNIEKTTAELEAARARQADLFAQVEADRTTIESRVADKRAYLDNLTSQIAMEEAGRRANDSSDSPSIWHGTLPPASSGVVAIAYALIGVPYVYGGSSPDSGFDCSGFVGYCYAQIGISLNRTADYPPNLSWEELEPGDLVYSHGGEHVGIYVGGGMQIHAPYSGTVVQEGSISGFCGGYRP
jgi:peptidoglycan DL-endopeptidase CwlO